MTAAEAMMGSDAVKDVVGALEGLIHNLDEDQKMETEHKEWCEDELAQTAQKKAHHEQMVEDLAGKIADLTGLIAEKKQGISDTIEAIARADKNMEEATAIRAQMKADFEKENADYQEALNALNNAIDILSKFYASKKGAFAQVVPPKTVAPGVFDNAYQQKGGSGIIEMITVVRKEYEQGKADLNTAEEQSIKDFVAAKAAYQAARRDLVAQKDQLEVELQTAEAAMDQAIQDKAANEQEVVAATTYLAQLGSSCDSLLKHYDERKNMRVEEKAAINKAIEVLENETF